MARTCWRMGLFATIMGWVLGSLAGCNVLAPVYFAMILIGKDQRAPAKFEFPEDAQRVAVIVYSPIDTQIEVGHFDRDLNEAVARKLFEGFEAEKKPIKVITAGKVARYQDEHPDWRSSSAGEIGKSLQADYVIYVELERLRFYGEGSNRTLFQGYADLSVSVVRVNEGEGDVVFPADNFSVEFPKDRPIPVTSELSFPKFKRAFTQRIAEQVSWYFLPHDTAEEFPHDPF